jgi:hypothetical protein
MGKDRYSDHHHCSSLVGVLIHPTLPLGVVFFNQLDYHHGIAIWGSTRFHATRRLLIFFLMRE